ncbi:hypothetical protein AN1V17_03510 [Vallitalea sediminicola]
MINVSKLNEWSSTKYIADAKIKALFRKLKELDTGEMTTGVAEGSYEKTGVWEHYKIYVKKNELLYKEKTGQAITPYDIYEFSRLSAMVDLIDAYGDSVYITKNKNIIQSRVAERLGANVQILENNDILFTDKNVIWKYVGEDTYEASRNLVHGGYGARSVEAAKRLAESSSATALGHAVQNRELDLTVEELQFLYSMDPHGAKEYVTGIPGYTQKEKQHKRELREELYKLLERKEIQYYKHEWSSWEKTDKPKGNIWGTVKSNADFALEVNDGIPDDLIGIVKPITYTAVVFYGLYSLGVFLEGVSIYGYKVASGLASHGMLKEMIADYNSTLGSTDADEQFIINALNSTDKDEELVEEINNSLGKVLKDKTRTIRNKVSDSINAFRNSDKYKNLSNTQRKKIDRKLNSLHKGNVATADVKIEGIKKQFNAHSQIHSAESLGADIIDFSYTPKANLRIFKNYVEDGFPRYNDTEAKILEDIATQIKDLSIKGEINLFTELDTCQSCTNIILEFRKRYPNITLNIFTNNTVMP